MNEIWKDVVGYEGIYQVSNTGNVRRVKSGQKYGQMNAWENHNGYMHVRLTAKIIDKRKIEKVHRLVATAFIPNSKKLPFVNHIDNNPSNNSIENFEWCTQKENLDHARSQGRMYSHPKGKPSSSRSLTQETADKIREYRLSTGLSYQKIADKFNTNKKTVMSIINGESYV